VEGDVQIRDILPLVVLEIPVQTPQNRLMRNNDDRMSLPLDLEYNGLQPLYEIHVALAHRVPVGQFVLGAQFVFGRVLRFYFIVGHAVEYTG